jgi:hypothetical protein
MSSHCNKYPACGCSSSFGMYCQSNMPLDQIQLANAKDKIDQIDDPIAVKVPSRNKPCQCGSGKNYKNCHGKSKSIFNGK